MRGHEQVTLRLTCNGQAVEVRGSGFAEVRRKLSTAWTALFADGPAQEIAAMEVVVAEISEAGR